jgi:hypothetical protein
MKGTVVIHFPIEALFPEVNEFIDVKEAFLDKIRLKQLNFIWCILH